MMMRFKRLKSGTEVTIASILQQAVQLLDCVSAQAVEKEDAKAMFAAYKKWINLAAILSEEDSEEYIDISELDEFTPTYGFGQVRKEEEDGED